MKGSDEVISEFNELVNMTADELEIWLKSDDANSAGWPKDDSTESETVGHDSGRKIVEILRHNPDKKPEEYTDEQVDHMRKVVSYNKRHLAQEKGANEKKTDEEVKKTKSYASLKNWGHDFLKAQGRGGGYDSGAEGEGQGEESNEAQADNKRKKAEEENGSAKKRETRKGKGMSTKQDEGDEGRPAEEGDGDEDSGYGVDEEEEEENEEEQEGGEGKRNEEKSENSRSRSKKGPKKGDKVSWKWGRGRPEGEVLDVQDDKTTITTKRGSKVSRHGNPADPAVVLDAGKSKAVKLQHELNES